MKRFLHILLLVMGFAVGPGNIAAAETSGRQLVIYDNDWSVTNGGYVSESALMLLLANPQVEVLGLTSVSGDYWRDEGVTTLLRFLEIIGASRIPVHNGAVHPLVNSAKRHAAWEAKYGKIYWSGAWNDKERKADAHPDDPSAIIPPREGLPTHARVASQDAVSFMIDAVRRHPNQITIYAEGPLTNIALAVRQDPEFAARVKRIIVQGSSAADENDDGSKPAEFNFIFDPEAADIVLTAPWADLVLLGEVSNQTVLTATAVKRMRAMKTPASIFAADNASVDLPLWSQIGAAIIADPAIVRRSVRAIVDVSLEKDASYGRTRSWPADSPEAPQLGQRPVTLVTEVDAKRLVEDYLASLGKPIGD